MPVEVQVRLSSADRKQQAWEREKSGLHLRIYDQKLGDASFGHPDASGVQTPSILYSIQHQEN